MSPLASPTPEQIFTIALQHHRAGRTAPAEDLCRQLLADIPDHADALHLLGVIAHQRGRREQAVAWLNRAAAQRPDDPAVQLNQGAALLANRQPAEALAPLTRAVQLAPDSAEPQLQLGAALLATKDPAAAVAPLRRAVELQPDNADAWNNLGVAHYRLGELASALHAFQQTVALRPDALNAQKNLGNVLRLLGRPDEALAMFETAARLHPGDSDTQNNLGVAHEHARRWASAIHHYDRAIALAPQDAAPQWNLARLLLLTGDFSRAWPLFESRLRLSYLNLARDFPQPQWRGEPIAGKTLLLWTEGGFGDALNFIRFAPLIADRGATVLLECQPELASLLATVRGISAVFHRGDPLPPFELQCPLQSLMLAFGITEQTIPADVPYLNPPRPSPPFADDAHLKVGLAWAGSKNPQDSRSRTLATFAPLAAVPNVTFYRLQQGPEADEPPPPGITLRPAVEPGFDFADTAAWIANLDLVITVDTSVGHLAGALGKPVWVLLPFSPDFRWMLDRSDTPWYPTMRLFRQVQRGSWTEPIKEMLAALKSFP